MLSRHLRDAGKVILWAEALADPIDSGEGAEHKRELWREEERTLRLDQELRSSEVGNECSCACVCRGMQR